MKITSVFILLSLDSDYSCMYIISHILLKYHCFIKICENLLIFHHLEVMGFTLAFCKTHKKQHPFYINHETDKSKQWYLLTRLHILNRYNSHASYQEHALNSYQRHYMMSKHNNQAYNTHQTVPVRLH